MADMLIEYDADIVQKQHSQTVTDDQFVFYILQKAFVKDKTVYEIRDIVVVENNTVEDPSYDGTDDAQIASGVVELTYTDRRGTELTEELSYTIDVETEDGEYVYSEVDVSYY